MCPACPPRQIQQLAEMYATSSPALVRCGWGLERNRNGGSAAAAVLALPAVGGKFGVRGGGYSMSNSAAWGIKAAAWLDDTPEPPTRLVNMNHLGRALTEYDSPPVQMLFVYNCNPLATMPDQNRVLEGLKREDLFTVVYEQVVTDTARYADVLLPATTFLENYDIAKSYGPISLQLVRPVIEPVGEARPNAEVFSELAERLGVGCAEEETDTLLRIAGKLPPQVGGELMEHGAATPAARRGARSVRRRLPAHAGRKVNLFSETLDRGAPAGLYGFQPDPGDRRVPAGADFAGERKERVLDAGGAAATRRGAADESGGRAGARAGDRRPRPRLQRQRGSPLPRRPEQGHPPGHRVAAEGALAQEHLQRPDVQRARARHPDRPRRRRVLQRRPRPGGLAGKH